MVIGLHLKESNRSAERLPFSDILRNFLTLPPYSKMKVGASDAEDSKMRERENSRMTFRKEKKSSNPIQCMIVESGSIHFERAVL
jgi:hypothetical protein